MSKVNLKSRAKPDTRLGEDKSERDFNRQSDPRRGQHVVPVQCHISTTRHPRRKRRHSR